MDISIRWLWVAMLGGSIMLALPGNADPARIVGDIVGHFFSAFLLAIVAILGYRMLYKGISEKEITYIFGASWACLVLSKFMGF